MLIALGLCLSACTVTAGIGSLGDAAARDGGLRDITPETEEREPPDDLGNATGVGSGTLNVQARITASATAGSQPAAAAKVEYSVRLEKSSSHIDSATVTIRNAGGSITLVGRGSGEYRATAVGYHRKNTLEVVSGSDSLRDATLVGPAAHRITNPTSGMLHPPNTPLTIRWDQAGAGEVEVKTKDTSYRSANDTGSHLVSAQDLAGEKGKRSDERAQVYRTNVIALTGDDGESSFKIQFRNEVAFVVDAKKKP